MIGPGMWRVLGIAETGDEAAIRAAYAARLKLTNPEDDAEGFKQLRRAYEAALRQARWRARNANESPLEALEEDSWADGEETQAAHNSPSAFPPFAAQQSQTPAAAAPVSQDAPADDALGAHYEARHKFEAALLAGDQPWAVMAAYEAVVRSPAMARLAVYTATEAWLASLLHRTRGQGELMLASAIKDFAWEAAARQVRGGIGAGILGLRESIAQEVAAAGLLARVRDKRHEFHAAFRELGRAPSGRNWLSRLWSLRRLSMVRRFLDYVEDKSPFAYDELDYDAVEWWRRRIAGWKTPLWVADLVVRFSVVALVAAAFVIFAGEPAPEAPSQPNIAAARELCRLAAAADTPRVRECDPAMAMAPDSLLVQQYAGILELKRGNYVAAEVQFQAILDLSPLDPVALYGKGLARFNWDDAENEADLFLMRQALRIDDALEAYLLEFGVDAAEGASPAEIPPPWPERPAPAVDALPHHVRVASSRIEAEAYRHFGFEQGFEAGEVRLECMARADGSLTGCLIMDEIPRNAGRGEVALRIVSQARVTPATLAGEPVDFAPIQIRFMFELQPRD